MKIAIEKFWCVKYYKAQPYNMEHTLCVCVGCIFIIVTLVSDIYKNEFVISFLYMTSYDYITFDFIGLFQRNRFSKIVSLKKTLQYKFLKELTVEDLQDDKKALEKLNKCWKVFVRY